ncbi:hypothetical protein CPB86DRAFT_817304 [Serendipita vermifera]|nr:hypothetical protein CPB86DRAFT_817304 [Serendipita vermifera]
MQLTSPMLASPSPEWHPCSLAFELTESILREIAPPVIPMVASQEPPSNPCDLSPELTVLGSNSSDIRFILSTSSLTAVSSLPSNGDACVGSSSKNDKRCLSKLPARNRRMSTPLRKNGPSLDLQRDTFGRKVHLGKNQLVQHSSPLAADRKRATPYRMMVPRTVWHHFKMHPVGNDRVGEPADQSKRRYLQTSKTGDHSVIINEDLWEDERNPFVLTAFDFMEGPLDSHRPANHDRIRTPDKKFSSMVPSPSLSRGEQSELELFICCSCSDCDLSPGRFMDEWESCLNEVFKD